jgi:salicylate hydroxylase
MLLITHPVETGELIGYLDWAEPVIQDIGAMFCMIRVCPIRRVGIDTPNHEYSQFSDIQDILYAAAVRAGAQVIFDTKVSFADSPCPSEPSGNSSSLPSCERPSVHLSDGTVLQADMIIGADGQHSTVRSSVQEEDVKPKRTDTIVLSGNVPMKDILEDDVLKTQRVAYGWVFWLGPRRCFMGALSFLIDIASHSPRL